MQKDAIYRNAPDFSKVYSIYFPKLVRFAREFVLSTENAENIIQDIFIYLWEHQEVLGNLIR